MGGSLSHRVQGSEFSVQSLFELTNSKPTKLALYKQSLVPSEQLVRFHTDHSFTQRIVVQMTLPRVSVTCLYLLQSKLARDVLSITSGASLGLSVRRSCLETEQLREVSVKDVESSCPDAPRFGTRGPPGRRQSRSANPIHVQPAPGSVRENARNKFKRVPMKFRTASSARRNSAV